MNKEIAIASSNWTRLFTFDCDDQTGKDPNLVSLFNFIVLFITVLPMNNNNNNNHLIMWQYSIRFEIFFFFKKERRIDCELIDLIL